MGSPATRGAVFCVLIALVSFPWLASADQGATRCSADLLEAIPARSPVASRGSDFAGRTAHLDGTEREALIREELLAGNLPDFLRRLEAVSLSGKRSDGTPVEVTICVAPDYLAIGSASDYLRVPMGLETAVTVASRFGFVLPTRKMVDAIYEQAVGHLTPQPMTPGAAMVSTDYFVRHNRGIEAQCAAEGIPEGLLIAGHKKDLVLTNRLRKNPGRVAIYGWHRANGKPIQPLSTVHGAAYADYSHGVRLVSEVAYVDGQAVSIFDVLEDPRLAGILSDEGPIPRLASLMKDLGGGPIRAAKRGSSTSGSKKDS